MNISYIVQSPIYGYNGLGYSDLSFLERGFDSELKARKRLNDCNKAFELYNNNRIDETEEEESFYLEITEGVSFYFKGKSILIKRTEQDEIIT